MKHVNKPHAILSVGGDERIWKLTGEVRQMTINGGIVMDHAGL